MIEAMPEDRDSFRQDEPLGLEAEPSLPGAGNKRQDNLLLLSGIGLVLLAACMALSSFLPF